MNTKKHVTFVETLVRKAGGLDSWQKSVLSKTFSSLIAHFSYKNINVNTVIVY